MGKRERERVRNLNGERVKEVGREGERGEGMGREVQRRVDEVERF